MKLRLADGSEFDTDTMPGLEFSAFGGQRGEDGGLEIFFLRDGRVEVKIVIPERNVVDWFRLMARVGMPVDAPKGPGPKDGH